MAGGEGAGRGIAGLKNVRTGGGFPIWGGDFCWAVSTPMDAMIRLGFIEQI